MTQFINDRQRLITELQRYIPWNAQEEKDKLLILTCLNSFPNIFTRENRLAHMTVSAWVVNPTWDRALMAYHNIYKSWSWLGGHADGECDLLAAALREVTEESGIARVRPLSPLPYSLESLTVDGHVKHGEYVSSHLHLNITYLLEADDSAPTVVKPDENSAVGWFPLEEAVSISSEPWFQEHIYKKLNDKLEALKRDTAFRGAGKRHQESLTE
ncbi:MAG: NUDIX hydrolase [Clostridia bacterium]|nr:NUDIX hydrolase [Clostridia bacterium]